MWTESLRSRHSLFENIFLHAAGQNSNLNFLHEKLGTVVPQWKSGFAFQNITINTLRSSATDVCWHLIRDLLQL